MFKVKLLPHNRRVRDTLTINHNLSKRAGSLAGGGGDTRLISGPCTAARTTPLLQHGRHVPGDRRLRPEHVRVGSRVLHLADGLLEGVLPRRDRHHHGDILVQSVEGLCHRLHWGLQL